MAASVPTTLCIPGESSAVYQLLELNKHKTTLMDIVGLIANGKVATYVPTDDRPEFEVTICGLQQDGAKKRVRALVKRMDDVDDAEDSENEDEADRTWAVSWKRIRCKTKHELTTAGEAKAGKKARKPKKPVDPNRPTRPQGPYFRFQAEKIKGIKADGACTHKEAMVKVSAMWKEMSDDDKEPYVTAAKADTEKWKKAIEAYDNKD